MVDCSHGNSKKDHKNQPGVCADLAKQVANGNSSIVGMMIESNLVEGKQSCTPGKTDLSTLEYGKSITDACVHFDDTIVMLDGLAKAVQERRKTSKL